MSDITCYDSNGNVLKKLYQYDTGQTMTVSGADTSKTSLFHFCNRKSKKALVVRPTVSGQNFVVRIPDPLLQQNEFLNVFLYQDVGNDEYRTVYEGHIEVETRSSSALPSYSVQFVSDGVVLETVEVQYGSAAVYTGSDPVKTGVEDPENYEFIGWYPEPNVVTENMVCEAQFAYEGGIPDTWAVISQRSLAGTAADYYSVGDSKVIQVSGTVGTLNIDESLFVFILGFDHNSELEGTGISFGGFKNANGSDAKDVSIVDSMYATSPTNGTKAFQMSHSWGTWGNVNCGGWKGCDLRYDILGSTDVAPSGYGQSPTSDRVGYDATSTCATNPVSGTLMSCLPSSLRAVMRPITKYTDNVGNGSGSVQANVTASIDYLPLMSPKEFLGVTTYVNTYEPPKQARYTYYANGVAPRFMHSNSSAVCSSLLRSPYPSNNFMFIYWLVTTDGQGNYPSTITLANAVNVYGLAPVFLV